MKRYKLLKDLPLYPAGTICEIRKFGNCAEAVFKVNDDDSLVEIMDRVELRAIREQGKFDEWFEEIDESKVWKPKYGQAYFFIGDDGELYGKYRHSKPDYEDDRRISAGNCYKTEREGEMVIEKLKALRRLREKGLVFKSWEASGIHIAIHASIPDISCSGQDVTDLDLLFKEED